MAKVTKNGTLLIVGVMLLTATDAAAQFAFTQWTDRGYVNINGAYQVKDIRFTQTLTESIYGEAATYTLTHDAGGGAMFDIGFGGRVWRNLAAGLSVSAFGTTSSLDATGSVPHPLFFNRPRTVSSRQDTLDHRQVGYHVQFSWFAPVTDEIDVAVFAGPSFISVDQQIASQVTIAEASAPYNTATVSQVVTREASESATGGNIGVDVTYRVTELIGAGLNLRWTGGSVDLTTPGGSQSIDVGGFQVGIGARVRF